jgi:repressor LexA
MGAGHACAANAGPLQFAFRSPTVARMPLTRRQKQLLDYLRAHIRDHGYAPTLEEMCRHLRLSSVATVHKHLGNLETKGLLRRQPHRSRGLELAPRSRAPRAVEVPLLGRVAAGVPIEPVEEAETIALPEELLGRGDTFALRVRGDSMVGDGILDGDVIVVESRRHADDGATVVALVRGEATVKRLYRERGRIRLQPANDRLAPIVARADDLEIRGVVIAVLRRYR